MIEQLQPRGGTEKVLRIMMDMMNACYRPSPSGRKRAGNGQFMESGVDKWGRSVDNPKDTMEGHDVHDKTHSNQWPLPALFMSASAAIADSLL